MRQGNFFYVSFEVYGHIGKQLVAYGKINGFSKVIFDF